MNKIVLALLFSISITHAGQFDDALGKIKTTLDENTDIYRKGMEKSHKSRLQTYFFARENTKAVLLQSIYETSVKNVLFQGQLVNDLKNESLDAKEDLYKLFIVKNSIEDSQRKLKRSHQNLLAIKKSTQDDCSNGFVEKIDNKYDPTKIYAIPTIQETDGGYPVYNLTFEMNLSYYTDSETIGYSAGGVENTDEGNDTKEIVVTGVAAVAQVVACVYVYECTGVTFMIAATAMNYIYDIIGNIIHNDKAEEFQDNLRKLYREANSSINQVHVDLKKRNRKLINEICTELNKEDSVSNVESYIASQLNLLSKIDQQAIQVNKAIDEYARKIDKDRKILYKMFNSHKKVLLKKYRDSLEGLRKIYDREGKEVVAFYTDNILPLYRKNKKGTYFVNIKNRHRILSKVIEGNILFGDSIVWKVLKSQLIENEGEL